MLACEVGRCWSALHAFLVLELVHLVVNGIQDSTALFASASKALSSQGLHAPSSHAPSLLWAMVVSITEEMIKVESASCRRTAIDVGLGNNCRLSSSPQPERLSLSSSTGKITGPFKCSSCLIFVAVVMVAFNSAVSLSLHPGSRQLHPAVLRNRTLAPLDVPRQRLLLTFYPVDAVVAVRVLGVIIKFVLFHRRVGDELNLLELCTTLLVDTSGASSSVMIKSVTRALMMNLLRGAELLKRLPFHLHQRTDPNRPLVSVGAEKCMALETCKLLFMWLAVERTPANSSRVPATDVAHTTSYATCHCTATCQSYR